MNEFVAKKLGEVLAFAHVGLETFDQGKGALEHGFGPTQYNVLRSTFEKQKALLDVIASEAKIHAIVQKKLESTGAKLRTMRDVYVGDEWDNFVKLLAWHGLFEGAALIHWELVVGGAHAIRHQELLAFANEALAFHQKFLTTISLRIHAIGSEKAKS